LGTGKRKATAKDEGTPPNKRHRAEEREVGENHQFPSADENEEQASLLWTEQGASEEEEEEEEEAPRPGPQVTWEHPSKSYVPAN